MSHVLLSSGGMDSFLLAHYLHRTGHNAAHVFVDIGQRYRDKELLAASYVAGTVGAPFHIAEGSPIGSNDAAQGIIPFRNAHLILDAARHGTDIYMGVIADEINSDKSPEFLRAMEQVLNISHREQYWTKGKQYRIHTPLRAATKSQLVANFMALGGKRQQLLATVSCYAATDTHCGQCPSCFKRWVALVNNGLSLDQFWLDWPGYWHPVAHWQAKAKQWPPDRAQEVLGALQRAPQPTQHPATPWVWVA